MASDFGLNHSPTQFFSPSMSRKEEEEAYDDSWEVRAFEEDTTGNALGCTWPPRSYTCTFCRREFRSAQALGGHMNVHRRDRARLHDAPPPLPPPTLLIPTRQEFMPKGLCLIYPLPNPSSILFPTTPPINSFPTDTAPNNVVSIREPSASNIIDNNGGNNYQENGKDCRNHQEVDLELRLGSRR